MWGGGLVPFSQAFSQKRQSYRQPRNRLGRLAGTLEIELIVVARRARKIEAEAVCELEYLMRQQTR